MIFASFTAYFSKKKHFSLKDKTKQDRQIFLGSFSHRKLDIGLLVIMHELCVTMKINIQLKNKEKQKDPLIKTYIYVE